MPADATRGLLLDLDGTLYQDGAALPGAVAAVRALQDRYRVGFLTNTTSRSRAAVASKLRDLGFEVAPEEIVSPPALAGARLRQEGATARLFVAEAARDDFAGVEDAPHPHYVVLGDLGEAWTFERLNEAFQLAMNGAKLLALGKTRYWRRDGALHLDAGPFVAALEYATGQTAAVLGKPDATFFQRGAALIGCAPEHVVVVGDDVETDVRAAIRAGMRGVLVQTGKYRPGDEGGNPPPTALIPSIADLEAHCFM